MIHRTYVVRLPPANRDMAYLPCDIVLAVPGSYAAPVADAATYVGATVTAPPAGWVAACGAAAYYELRGRALRLEQVVGQAGFTPRTRLGFHLSILTLQEPAGGARQFTNYDQVPFASLSASLSLPPGSSAAIWGSYANVFTDPSYGPVIRIWNQAELHSEADPIYLVNFQIAENKDEDFETLGHA